MVSRILKMVKGKKGQGMVEYALIIALVAVLLVGGLVAMRGQISGIFSGISGELENASDGSYDEAPAEEEPEE